MTTRRSLLRVTVVLAAIVLVAAACGSDDDPTTPAAAAGKGNAALVGLFRVAAGACGGAGATGSYFRMIQPGGTPEKGPFVVNGDSPCTDKTWTPLTPGTDGGLRTGAYQPQPAQPFDGGGNAASNRIVAPQKWFAVAFGLSTNPKDPQTGTATPQPRVTSSGGKLSGELSAVGASWNGQHFNQGAPKPGGATGGNTVLPHGTYDAATHAYVLEWASQIVGGPFNNFTGVWHLEGTFEAS